MSLRLKFGLSGITRMPVVIDGAVTAVVRNALVQGDWLQLSSSAAASGMPLAAGGVELRGIPVTATAHRLCAPIIGNPQQPDTSVPGCPLTVASWCSGEFGYTDRYNTGVAASAYADVALVAKLFTVGGVNRYGLVPADAGELLAHLDLAWGLGIYNSELVFRFY